MTRHDEPSKAAKTQRRGTLSSAKMGRISRHGGSAAAVNETGFAQLIRERDEALQQQAATSEVLSKPFTGRCPASFRRHRAERCTLMRRDF
jgi:hypothetical protein